LRCDKMNRTKKRPTLREIAELIKERIGHNEIVEVRRLPTDETIGRVKKLLDGGYLWHATREILDAGLKPEDVENCKHLAIRHLMRFVRSRPNDLDPVVFDTPKAFGITTQDIEKFVLYEEAMALRRGQSSDSTPT
jgi:hypothetical protein